MNRKLVVFLTKDLFFIPMLRVASDRAGCDLVFAPSLGNSRLESVLSDDVALCILDLTIVPADQIAHLVQLVRERFPTSKLAAFGPHVHDQNLKGAAEAKVDFVVTRGQLNKNPDQCLRQWVGAELT